MTLNRIGGSPHLFNLTHDLVRKVCNFSGSCSNNAITVPDMRALIAGRRQAGETPRAIARTASGTGRETKPRRLPGRSCLHRSKTPGKDSFLHMQPILGFVEYDGLRTVDHIVGDLLAAMGRQAMHEDRVLARGGHQFRVDLIGRKQAMAKGLVHVAHRNPAIRDDRIRSPYRLMGIVDELHAGTRTARPIDEAGLRIEFRRELRHEAKNRIAARRGPSSRAHCWRRRSKRPCAP